MNLVKGRPVAFLAVAFVAAVLLPATVRAADPAKDSRSGPRRGYPVDWSSHHVMVTGNNPSLALKAGLSDPRHVYSQVRRMVAVRNAKLERNRERDRERKREFRRLPKVDWAVSLERGFVPANQFPAKFSFDVSAQDCTAILYFLD
jgi:hypothetical protein